MSDSEKYPYLWIPEDYVTEVPLEPDVREDAQDSDHEEHGLRLLRGLSYIEAFFARLHRDGTVPYDNQLIFKVILGLPQNSVAHLVTSAKNPGTPEEEKWQVLYPMDL